MKDLTSKLASLDDEPLQLTTLKNHVKENIENNINMNQQLHALKEKYYEVKKKFEYIKGRSKLVEHIQRMDGRGLNVPPLEFSVESAEQSYKAQKAELNSLKKSLKMEKDRLQKLIQVVSKEYEEMLQKQSTFEESKKKSKNGTQRIHEWQEDKRIYGECSLEQLKMENIDDANSILREQEKAIETVTQECQNVEDQLRSLSKEVGQAKGSLAPEVEEKQIPEVDMEELNLKESTVRNWSAALNKLESLKGCKIDMKDHENVCHLRATYTNKMLDMVFTVLVQIDKQRDTIIKADVTPGGEAVTDILVSAAYTTDVPFLVEEIWNRVTNCETFKKQVKELKGSYSFAHSMDTEANLHRLRVVLPGGLDCELQTSLDYPMRHAKHVRLVSASLDKKEVLNEEEIMGARENMKAWESENKGWNLAEWVAQAAKLLFPITKMD